MNRNFQHVQFKPRKEQRKFPKLRSCSLWPRLELSSSPVLKRRFSSLFHSDESYSTLPNTHKSTQPPNTTIISTTSAAQTQSLSCYRLKSTNAGRHCIETSLWLLVFCFFLFANPQPHIASSPPLRISTPSMFAPILSSGFKCGIWASGEGWYSTKSSSCSMMCAMWIC